MSLTFFRDLLVTPPHFQKTLHIRIILKIIILFFGPLFPFENWFFNFFFILKCWLFAKESKLKTRWKVIVFLYEVFCSQKWKQNQNSILTLKLPFLSKKLSVYFTPQCWVCYEIAPEIAFCDAENECPFQQLQKRRSTVGFVLSLELLERTFLMREFGTTHLLWWKCFVQGLC